MATLVAFSGAASANDNLHNASIKPNAQCAPLYQSSTGRKINASYSSYKYSQENIGAVGISIFPGQDATFEVANSLGTKIATVLKRHGVEAECFVHNEIGPKGTGFNFDIVGIPWSEDRPLNAKEATSKDVLKAVLERAKIAKDVVAVSNDESSRSRPELALNN